MLSPGIFSSMCALAFLDATAFYTDFTVEKPCVYMFLSSFYAVCKHFVLVSKLNIAQKKEE